MSAFRLVSLVVVLVSLFVCSGAQQPLESFQSGRISYYDYGAGGTYGTCSYGPLDGETGPHTDNVASLSEEFFANSARCGECFEVNGPKGSAVAMVVDMCPDSDTSGLCSGQVRHLVLNRPAFADVAEISAGVVDPIQYRKVTCPVTGNIGIRIKEGSSNGGWLAVMPFNHRVGISSIEGKATGGTTWTTLPRENYNYFIWDGVPPAPIDLRITAVTGASEVVTLQSVVPDTVVTTTVQFAAPDTSSTTGASSTTAVAGTTGAAAATTGLASSATTASATTGVVSATTGIPAATTGVPPSTTGVPPSTTGVPVSTTGVPSTSVTMSTTSQNNVGSDSSDSGGGGGGNAGAIAGAVVGVVAALLVCALVAVLVIKRRNKKKSSTEAELGDVSPRSGPSVTAVPPKMGEIVASETYSPIGIRRSTLPINSPKAEPLRLIDGSVEILSKLGGGNFGVVYRGLWQGTTDVALKQISDRKQIDEFLSEASMLQSLSHLHVVQYYGVYHNDNTDEMYIVMEFLPKGSLRELLINERKTISTDDLLEMAKQAAAGMEYLERKHIIHRDLALRNLLVTVGVSSKFLVKVADFGLSRNLQAEEYYKSTESSIPVRWSAPEVMEYGKFTTKSDVWAFGVVLWELFSYGKRPYTEMENSEVIKSVINNYRLACPEGCPEPVYQLMLSCWSRDPDERPTFQSVFEQLRRLSRSDDANSDKHEYTTFESVAEYERTPAPSYTPMSFI